MLAARQRRVPRTGPVVRRSQVGAGKVGATRVTRPRRSKGLTVLHTAGWGKRSPLENITIPIGSIRWSTRLSSTRHRGQAPSGFRLRGHRQRRIIVSPIRTKKQHLTRRFLPSVGLGALRNASLLRSFTPRHGDDEALIGICLRKVEAPSFCPYPPPPFAVRIWPRPLQTQSLTWLLGLAAWNPAWYTWRATPWLPPPQIAGSNAVKPPAGTLGTGALPR